LLLDQNLYFKYSNHHHSFRILCFPLGNLNTNYRLFIFWSFMWSRNYILVNYYLFIDSWLLKYQDFTEDIVLIICFLKDSKRLNIFHLCKKYQKLKMLFQKIRFLIFALNLYKLWICFYRLNFFHFLVSIISMPHFIDNQFI
jgi:hypothetical protein